VADRELGAAEVVRSLPRSASHGKNGSRNGKSGESSLDQQQQQQQQQ
jgi:hypothetical protein